MGRDEKKITCSWPIIFLRVMKINLDFKPYKIYKKKNIIPFIGAGLSIPSGYES